MALRKKLGETVEELERLRLEHSSLSARYKSAEQELSLAKSDRMFPLAVACTLLTNEAVSLVGKDEIDMIKSLRASLSVDKDLLASELSRVQASLRDAEDSTKMQLSQVSISLLSRIRHSLSLQINGLLLEQVSLQRDGIQQREKLLERERDARYGLPPTSSSQLMTPSSTAPPQPQTPVSHPSKRNTPNPNQISKDYKKNSNSPKKYVLPLSFPLPLSPLLPSY
jgi:hypothetical protein